MHDVGEDSETARRSDPTIRDSIYGSARQGCAATQNFEGYYLAFKIEAYVEPLHAGAVLAGRERGRFFGLIIIPFSLFFISGFLGDKGLTSRIGALGATTLSTLAALPIWAIINLIVAPIKALKAETGP